MGLTSALAAKALTTRGVVRAPIALYRHGWGWLFGSRILMLEHTGRTTGQPRYVCLEVVERPAADRVVVVSGFGARAQWYRNLAADPHCRVTIGRRASVPATARLMDAAESRDALIRYQQAHPAAWRQLRRVIEKAVHHPVEELPMVELALAAGL